MTIRLHHETARHMLAERDAIISEQSRLLADRRRVISEQELDIAKLRSQLATIRESAERFRDAYYAAPAPEDQESAAAWVPFQRAENATRVALFELLPKRDA